MSRNKIEKGSMGFFGLLALLFIGIKLWGTLTWFWIWILWPIWLPISLVIGDLIVTWVSQKIRVRKLRK